MNRVLDRLFIGTARDLALPLAPLGFAAALDLRDGAPAPPDVPTHRMANRDGDPWPEDEVARAFAFVYDGLKKGRVLVACDAGMSRSASMVVGFLVRCGWDAPTAIAQVRAARPKVAPKAAMLDAAIRAARGG